MDWHSRFLQQAAWTHDLRAYLFTRAGLNQARRVLEVGCGSGAVLSDIATPATIHGLDLEPACLTGLQVHIPSAAFICGNALQLPYASKVFDIAFCHFLLLWVPDPLKAICEMKRVTRSGGSVLALAEPDYESRQDKPAALAPLGRWQAESLRQQGADPGLGSRLSALFVQAGIQPVETGTLQKDAGYLSTPAERELEWDVLEADLAGRIPAQEISALKVLEEQAWQRGERVLYVPTHFAWGSV
jgi:SAM-dependent methyltransferase